MTEPTREEPASAVDADALDRAAAPLGPTGSVAEAASAASVAADRGDDVWTVLRMILWSAEYLQGKGIASGRLDAEHLLAHVVGVGRLQLYLDFERPLTREERDAFRPLLRRRAAREPLQYVIGRQPFRTLDLAVEPGVLIPRPETELLVDEVCAWLAEAADPGASVVDIGTGSGALALSIAAECRCGRVVATDVAEAAVSMSARNRDAHDLADRVEIRRGSLFEALAPGERFSVIVSNPPYVAEVDEATLEPEVRDWEPREALFAGADGLDVLRALVEGAPRHLVPQGLLAVEVGAGQAAEVASLVEGSGAYRAVRTRKDYEGIERFVLAHAA